jgi:hypothetical protein
MLRHPDRDTLSHGALIALTLVAMVVRMQDRHDTADADLAQVVEHGSAAEVNEDGLIAVSDCVDIADVVKAVEVIGEVLPTWE